MADLTCDYERPAVAADIAVFSLREEELVVLLIKRKNPPHEGSWALPGGFLRRDEDLDACARRELEEEAGVYSAALHPFGAFSAPGRDPRWVVSAAYVALTPLADHRIRAATDASEAAWFEIGELPPLAFDHRDILDAAHAWLTERLERLDPKVLPYLLALVPERFTLARLQAVYEAVRGKTTDKRNFRRDVLATGLVQETDEFERGSHRPARLFTPKEGYAPSPKSV